MTLSVWGPVHRDVALLLAEHPDDVPAVVEQLARLQELLQRVPSLLCDNPVAAFNRLYLRITQQVLDRLYEGRFADQTFLCRLDVEFAARYFDALRLWTATSAACPRVWSVLFGRMAGPDCRPLPSAAAGVDAHINFDLPFALVTTFEQLGCDPADGSEQHDDYLQINDIFAESIPSLRRGYLQRWQLFIDTMNGELDDWLQGELVEYTRDLALRNAQRLWVVRHDPPALTHERSRLDGNAATLGRLLLTTRGSSTVTDPLRRIGADPPGELLGARRPGGVVVDRPDKNGPILADACTRVQSSTGTICGPA